MLNEVPIVNSVVNAAANVLKYSDNVTAQIVYNGWTGNGVRLLIVTTVSIIVVRALLLASSNGASRSRWRTPSKPARRARKA